MRLQCVWARKNPDMARQTTIFFHGGAGSVTGANFRLDTGGANLLLDCGIMQGGAAAEATNYEPFAYDPSTVTVLVVSHAHADHIGRIPRLVREGFSGPIYSTPPTRDLAAVMLRDAYGVMRTEARRDGREPLYELDDIDAALALWQTVGYGEPTELADDVTLTFRDAGHILGSAFVELERDGVRLVYTGDVGNAPQPLMNPPDIPAGYRYLITESVYGDRRHEEAGDRTELLLGHLRDTIAAGGTLVIPAFSLERTQALLFELNNFVETGLVEPLPVFLDSPLAIEVTGLYRTYRAYLRDGVQEQIREGDDIFDFPRFRMTRTQQESQSITATPGPKVIIAGSGMSEGGRIRAHERRYLDDPDATLLFVGYQAVGSTGRLLQDGARTVRLDGKEIRVRARIATIRGYSGHADRDALVDLAAHGGEDIERVFVTLGEERASLFLAQRLREHLGLTAVVPEAGSREQIAF